MVITQHPLLGTWRLIRQLSEHPHGKQDIRRGSHPAGMLMYDTLGNMSAHLMRTDAHATDHHDLSRIETALQGYHGYFGSYDVDTANDIVHHHVVGALYPPYRGTEQVRYYTLVGDVMALKVRSRHTTQIIEWARAGGDATMNTRLVGTWLLVSQYTVFADGHRALARGENPRGVLMYDALGNMSVHLMRTDARVHEFTDLLRFDTAMEGYHGYFGTYEIDEAAGIVRHHVVGAAYPPYRGSVQVRHFTLDGDTLILKVFNDDAAREIVWARASGMMG
jgi:Lipocalin-like domain